MECREADAVLQYVHFHTFAYEDMKLPCPLEKAQSCCCSSLFEATKKLLHTYITINVYFGCSSHLQHGECH
ncbi:hypothetical protein Dimus_000656, partial [Dionaea muscipula]